jgi:glycosyltransferase involved in cell wall biosynthesis/SAM-dependent methyltransferase
LKTYPTRGEVPVFIDNPNEVKVMPLEHTSNQMSDKALDWVKAINGHVLNIGAGATEIKAPNCIELEYSIYKNTDVAGDAHHLPFKDNVFDAVVSFNTFEHLHNPSAAAKEILRVLKPGGKILLQTAFLQPLHEEPHHYYGATKYGILNWFSDFQVENCYVSDNFSPAYTLAWLSNGIIHYVGQEFGSNVSKKLSETKLSDWSKIWLNPGERSGFIWDTLSNLPEHIQEKYCAGFEINATKPIEEVKYEGLTADNLASNSFIHPTTGRLTTNSQSLNGSLKYAPLSPIDEKRLSIVSRLKEAREFEKAGDNPWDLKKNSAYDISKDTSISVVITLFNYSKYIYECLDSVCQSELSNIPGNIEILVIDDCSTDESAGMTEKYLSESAMPICLIKKHFNTGLADARNVGLKNARSPYVFILDADNWIYPSCLLTLFNEIKSSNYASVYSKIRKFDNDTNKEIGLISSSQWSVKNLVKQPYIDAMAMFDKNKVLEVGGYSDELIEYGWLGWEDYDLYLKLAQKNYSCKFVPKVLSSYRVHSSSMINATKKYELNIARYFNSKFADLSAKYDHLEMLFGFSHSELDLVKQAPSQGFSSAELRQAYDQITAMQSSKFWKLRTKWIEVKKFLGLLEN